MVASNPQAAFRCKECNPLSPWHVSIGGGKQHCERLIPIADLKTGFGRDAKLLQVALDKFGVDVAVGRGETLYL